MATTVYFGPRIWIGLFRSDSTEDPFLQRLIRQAATILIGSCVIYFPLGCTSISEQATVERDYQAYGRKWKYTVVMRDIEGWGLSSTHGFFGKKEGTEQQIYLINEAGEKIPVHERIVALQRDGSYKKVPCCYSMSTLASVYQIDDKLVVTLSQTRENTTDCFVFPANRPDDENRPPKERVRYISLFGEFDPKEKVFRIADFYPGGVKFEDVRKVLGPSPSAEESDKFIYPKRVSFICGRT